MAFSLPFNPKTYLAGWQPLINRFRLPIAGLLLFSFDPPAPAADEPTQSAVPEQPAANPLLSDPIKRLLRPVEGVEIQTTYTGEGLGNFSGGFRRGVIYEGLLKTGVQLDLAKLCGWDETIFFTDILYPHGRSLTNSYVHDLNVLSSIDEYDSLRLAEVWIQKKFFDKKLSIRLGEIDVDTEFVLCDSGELFVNSCFGVVPTLNLNFPSPVYPLTAPGIRLEWQPTDAWTARLGAFSGDVGASGTTNKHGLRFAFSSVAGALFVGEVVYKTHTGEAAAGLPGTFKIGGFYDTGKFADVDQAGGVGRGDGGAYVILDQALYREPTRHLAHAGKDKGSADDEKQNDQGLNFFARAAYAAPQRHSLVTGYLECGMTYKGLLHGRDKDTCGVACSYTHLSPDLQDPEADGAIGHHETVIEASYQAVINDWLTVQPDFQYIINPGGTQRLPSAVVAGVRVTLTF